MSLFGLRGGRCRLLQEDAYRRMYIRFIIVELTQGGFGVEEYVFLLFGDVGRDFFAERISIA